MLFSVSFKLWSQHPIPCRQQCLHNRHKRSLIIMSYSQKYVFTGIGQGRVTNNVQGAPIDSAVHVTDRDAVAMVCVTFCMLCITFNSILRHSTFFTKKDFS